MARKFEIKLKTKDVEKILAEYFECDIKDICISPYENDRQIGVNVYVTTTNKSKAELFDDYI